MLPEDTFAGQVAVITGGGTGLGYGIAEKLGRMGAKLALVGRPASARNPDHIGPAAAKLESMGIEAIAVPTDIRQPDQVEAMGAQVLDRFGRMDMLVNSAAGNFIVDSEKLSVNGFNTVVASVLHGTFYCTRIAGLHFIESGRGGRILNIVASYAWTGGPKTLHSAVAKAGVVAMTRTLGAEWAHYGIRVNCISPGPTDTDGARQALWPDEESSARLRAQIPAGRFGEVDEVANAACYLLSPYADYITGEVLVIDGGQWLGGGSLR